jgi:hypothetical protein
VLPLPIDVIVVALHSFAEPSMWVRKKQQERDKSCVLGMRLTYSRFRGIESIESFMFDTSCAAWKRKVWGHGYKDMDTYRAAP